MDYDDEDYGLVCFICSIDQWSKWLLSFPHSFLAIFGRQWEWARRSAGKPG